MASVDVQRYAAPLIKSLRAALAAAAEPAAQNLRKWRVLAADQAETSQSCRADVDGRTRTITLH